MAIFQACHIRLSRKKADEPAKKTATGSDSILELDSRSWLTILGTRFMVLVWLLSSSQLTALKVMSDFPYANVAV